MKQITYPKWLALSAAITKCELQGPTMFRKHQPMNLGHSISQIMHKARQPSYPIKTNLSITSLIQTLGFKASSINQKTSHLEHPKLNTKGPNHIQNEPTTFSP